MEKATAERQMSGEIQAEAPGEGCSRTLAAEFANKAHTTHLALLSDSYSTLISEN